MPDSKVIRKYYGRVTRADYHHVKPVLGSENIVFPKTSSLQGQALPPFVKLSTSSNLRREQGGGVDDDFV